MLPKNSKHYIIPTAEELDISADLVEDVVGFFYRTVRTHLSDLKSDNLMIENLGSFKVKAKELPKLYAKYTHHLSVISDDTFNQMSIKKDVTQKLEKVIALQKLMNANKKRKTEFLTKKYGKPPTPTNLEK